MCSPLYYVISGMVALKNVFLNSQLGRSRLKIFIVFSLFLFAIEGEGTKSNLGSKYVLMREREGEEKLEYN